MKIGFYGNANNYPFMLARALRRLGHEVRFLVDGVETGLTSPENRYSDVGPPYPDWIQVVGSEPLWRIPWPTLHRRRIVQTLRQCDAVILNQLGPSLAPAIGRPAIALLTGTDLEPLASDNLDAVSRCLHAEPVRRPIESWGDVFRPIRALRSGVRRRRTTLVSRLQREGIRSARAVVYFARGIIPRGDAILDGIGVPDSRRFFLFMTDPDWIRFHPPPENPIPVAFCVARLGWKRPQDLAADSELNYKGTDVFLRGLGQFFRTSNAPLVVRMVKKGPHVAEAVELARQEGIADKVTWLDEMTQEQVIEEYRRADLVVDQLGDGMVGMGTLDAMATGRPVIANAKPEILGPALGGLPPICQARTAGEVCDHLLRLVPNPALREELGREARRFVEDRLSSDRGARLCLERLS
jgi:glycosyltransferase involved in cell wall biosynthesis